MSPADGMTPEGTRALGGLLLALAGAPRELRAQLDAPGTFTDTTDETRRCADRSTDRKAHQ